MKVILVIFFFANTIIFSQSVIINELMSSNNTTILDSYGKSSDWIEIYNPQDTTINLNGFTITDDTTNYQKWTFPNIELTADSYLLLFASKSASINEELHTNFKISGNGEIITLSDATGQIVEQVDSTIIQTDVSLGRNLANPSEWLFFGLGQATPGSANTGTGIGSYSEDPIFSIDGGFYAGSASVVLSTPADTADIYYTTDGSEPTSSSTLYSSSINIVTTKVIRAKSFSVNTIPSKIITNTFFLNESSTLPVFSISTNPANLWDDNIGIYVVGTNGYYDPSCGVSANYNQIWERPIHVAMYEPNGQKLFSMDAGVKINGGCYTGGFAQKSLRIKARGTYGASKVLYPLFNNREFTSYESFLLRNSGNDWEGFTMMRDGMMQTLVETLDLETLAYQPTVMFLNNEYWGIHNLRERNDKDYIAQYNNVDPNNLDLLDGDLSPKEGDANHYLNMQSYIVNNPLSIQANYEYVLTQMEIENYTDYMISEMYFNNRDWQPMNIKFWRPRTVDGKWRWLLFDTDFGFGYNDVTEYTYDMIDRVTNPSRSGSEIINGLLDNLEFENLFINTFADYSNTIFKAAKVVSVIDSISTLISPEITRHNMKWHGNSYWWADQVETLRIFANNRITSMQGHFISEFGLTGIAELNLNVTNNDNGYIKLNRITVKDFPWSGEYFQGVPITLEAVPRAGYKFVGWTGDVTSSSKIITHIPTSTNNLTAVFQESDIAYSIIMNEINYNSDGSSNSGDWVELYNNSTETVDVSGWIFKDSKDEDVFTIPQSTSLVGGEYLVLAESLTEFSSVHSGVTNVVGGFDGWKFSNDGELIRLYNQAEDLIDTIHYRVITPWPTSPAGGGPTLELKHPDLNNDFGVNWCASIVSGGTPGVVNGCLQKQSKLEINIFIEGAYSSASTMVTDVSQLTSFPKTQPFNTTPWNYTGGEEVLELPSSGIVDWVLVELRNTITSPTIVYTRGAFLKQDGSIVDLDGLSDLSFYDIPTGDYYIVVYHRNHLPVLSSNTIHVE